MTSLLFLVGLFAVPLGLLHLALTRLPRETPEVPEIEPDLDFVPDGAHDPE